MPNILADFIYKLLNNLILCRKVLKKWKRTNNDTCPVCKEVETIKHIYFDCPMVQHMWKKMGILLKMDITWRRIILGYSKENIHCIFRNLYFSVVLYALYKLWLKGIEDKQYYLFGSLTRAYFLEKYEMFSVGV